MRNKKSTNLSEEESATEQKLSGANMPSGRRKRYRKQDPSSKGSPGFCNRVGGDVKLRRVLRRSPNGNGIRPGVNADTVILEFRTRLVPMRSKKNTVEQ